MFKTISRRSFLTISAMTTAAIALDWRKISAYADRMGDKNNYPVVVIGAGLGGLSCAAYLAGQGIPVTVIEQHNIPGGYATAFDRAGGKFTFEVSLEGSSINNNATERILKELDVFEKLRLSEHTKDYCFKSPDLTLLIPQKGPDEYIRVLSENFPEEKIGITKFVQD